jgi:hypothetical protein
VAVTCQKRGYPRRTWAEQALARLVMQVGHQPTLHVYFCTRGCRRFHVGHKDGIWRAFGLLDRERKAAKG